MATGHPQSESGRVAIATPIYRPRLDPDDKLALHHLEHFLGHYDRWIFSPESLDIERTGYRVVHFPDRFFRIADSYSRLLLSSEFYRAFEGYEYLLIYQLDCLVFGDRLMHWCDAGWDYVGAPWLLDSACPETGFSRVGNGGFSLRRTASCLEVLDSVRYTQERVSFLTDLLRAPLPDLAPQGAISSFRHRVRVLREARRGVGWYSANYSLNEDRFWSDRAQLFLPDFRIPGPDQALAFSFERAPRYCFERNDRTLPFGCHAWKRWDPDFWRPYLLA